MSKQRSFRNNFLLLTALIVGGGFVTGFKIENNIVQGVDFSSDSLEESK